MTRGPVWTITDADELLSEETPRATRTLGVDEVGVHFQPIVDLATGRIFAQEALVRCRRPGFERPDVLLEAAVRERSIGYLGRLIREVALPVDERGAVFVNLHPEELQSRWLVRPDDPLNTYPGPLYLEITEAAAMSYFELCQSVLAEVCARTGAKIVVDDLGAGHSNLRRIVDLRPAVVKLDRELVRDLDKHPRQRILVANVVRLCSDLEAQVVAEGIETLDELKAVIDCGAHYGQGYFLARPNFPPPKVPWPPPGHAP
ncbi:MAG: EAL domain-containing protein [Myxococcales bacterium]|nr:EAL domain-containing protein [Myxococcales bacterium]